MTTLMKLGKNGMQCQANLLHKLYKIHQASLMSTFKATDAKYSAVCQLKKTTKTLLMNESNSIGYSGYHRYTSRNFSSLFGSPVNSRSNSTGKKVKDQISIQLNELVTWWLEALLIDSMSLTKDLYYIIHPWLYKSLHSLTYDEDTVNF